MNLLRVVMVDNKARLVLFGIATWLVPFVASIFFFDPTTHKLIIGQSFFQSIMVVIGSLVAAFLLVKYFKGVHADYVRQGIKVGVVWLLINWILDFAILVPMMRIDLPTYFTQIGLSYLVAPVMAISMAVAIENARKK